MKKHESVMFLITLYKQLGIVDIICFFLLRFFFLFLACVKCGEKACFFLVIA